MFTQSTAIQYDSIYIHLDMFNSFIAWFDMRIYIVYLYKDRQKDG